MLGSGRQSKHQQRKNQGVGSVGCSKNNGAVAQLAEYRIVYPVVAGSNPVSLAMVVVAQSVRASDCGSEGRGFKSHQPPCAVLPNGIGESLWKIASEKSKKD